MTDPCPTVLLVDDDVALRTAFARALEREGYRTLVTTGDPSVLDLIADHSPALVLLDNHMPGATGIELINLIRERWTVIELPIVLISGSSIQGEIDVAMETGANDFRRKPIDLADLVATVEGALRSASQLQAVEQGPSS